MTEADIAAMVAAGTAAGVFDPAERRIVERVFRLDDEPVAAMMTPRPDIVWLDVNDSLDAHYDVRPDLPSSASPTHGDNLSSLQRVDWCRGPLL